MLIACCELAAVTTIWTIGHSTHSFDEFVELLLGAGIERVLDVRTVPRSRHVPQFNREELEKTLPAAGIEYIHMKDLGGWRKAHKDSINNGWRNAGFRGYADYMQTKEFEQAAAELIRLAEQKPAAIMCAEAVPFRCHRSLISDYLITRGVEVLHIYPSGEAKPHEPTAFARVESGRITYPSPSDDRLF